MLLKDIKLLDCTLRDGGHLNKGNFGEKTIKNVIRSLINSHIDIVEVGFMSEESFSPDYTNFKSLRDVKRILPKNHGNSKISLMADFIDVDHFEENDGTVDIIRVSFKRHRISWALNAAKTLMSKGYKCCINPVNVNVYTDEQFIDVIKQVNELNPFCFTIVDTFGVLRKRDLLRLYSLADHNLKPGISIGLHLHENLGLSLTLAQYAIDICSPNRTLIIDGSLFGMGRVPGNLCIEQIMDHLNVEYNTNYELEYAYDAIDDYIAPIKQKIPWGYMIPYSLSASCKIHRTYAEYLMNKGKLKTKDIEHILNTIEPEESELFNEDYIERKYIEYMDVQVDTDDYIPFKKLFSKVDKCLVIAPGSSIGANVDRIIEESKKPNTIVVSVNFSPTFLDVDYVFCTNIKRYESENLSVCDDKLIITSNLKDSIQTYRYIFGFNDLSFNDNVFCDDSVLMFLNILKKIDFTDVSIAGFDGLSKTSDNYYISSLGYEQHHEIQNDKIKVILSKRFSSFSLSFITPSVYMSSGDEHD